MKKNRFIFFLSLCFMLCNTTAHAQAQLGLYTTSVSNSTPNIGDQFYLFASLKNYSATDTFNGVINFELANKDSIITIVTIVGKPPYTNTIIKLAPLEEKSALFTVQILPSHFTAGPDIIIVWPIASVPTVDSARAPIVIQNPLGIKEQTESKLHLFVFNEQIFIQNTDTENPLQQLQILNMNGQVVSAIPINSNSTVVPIAELPKGIYVAQLNFVSGERRMWKFMR